MKGILICPAERTAVRLLAEHAPLAILPAMGQGLLEYWLGHFARGGINEVMVLANDRAEQVISLVEDGARWGISVEVIAESRELSAAQALLKYQSWLGDPTASHTVETMDCFPGPGAKAALAGYPEWFAAVLAWLPRAQTPDRVGIVELADGVWTGAHSHIGKGAKLSGPCWIGDRVFLADGAVIGPHTVVEDGAFVEPGAEIAGSYIGAHTFVGRYTEIKDSLALGNTLLNLNTGSFAKVPDPFVLCALRQPRFSRSAGLLNRLSEFYSRNKVDMQVIWKHLLMNRQG
jgi:NDP-sugar pyrophosphorylase family protein